MLQLMDMLRVEDNVYSPLLPFCLSLVIIWLSSSRYFHNLSLRLIGHLLIELVQKQVNSKDKYIYLFPPSHEYLNASDSHSLETYLLIWVVLRNKRSHNNQEKGYRVLLHWLFIYAKFRHNWAKLSLFCCRLAHFFYWYFTHQIWILLSTSSIIMFPVTVRTM